MIGVFGRVASSVNSAERRKNTRFPRFFHDFFLFFLLYSFRERAQKAQCDSDSRLSDSDSETDGKLAAKLACQLSVTAADRQLCSIAQPVAYLLILGLTFYIS